MLEENGGSTEMTVNDSYGLLQRTPSLLVTLNYGRTVSPLGLFCTDTNFLAFYFSDRSFY